MTLGHLKSLPCHSLGCDISDTTSLLSPQGQGEADSGQHLFSSCLLLDHMHLPEYFIWWILRLFLPQVESKCVTMCHVCEQQQDPSPLQQKCHLLSPSLLLQNHPVCLFDALTFLDCFSNSSRAPPWSLCQSCRAAIYSSIGVLEQD